MLSNIILSASFIWFVDRSSRLIPAEAWSYYESEAATFGRFSTQKSINGKFICVFESIECDITLFLCFETVIVGLLNIIALTVSFCDA